MEEVQGQRTSEVLKKLPPEAAQILLTALTDQMSAKMEPPPGKVTPEELYMMLHPAVRRLLIELGHEENQDVLKWFLGLTKEKVECLDGVLRDYKNVKNTARLARIVWWSLVGMIGSIFATVKGAPEVVDWIKGHLK